MTIAVEDVNDNHPSIIVNVLTSSGTAEVRENVDPAGTFVAHLSAHDADSGRYGKVECQLSDGDKHLFRLEALFDVVEPRYQRQCQCQSKIVNVARIAELLRRRSRVTELF